MHREGCRITSQNLGFSHPGSVPSPFQMALDHTLAPAASAGLGCKLGSENCPQQSFQKCSRSHFRACFISVNCFRRRTCKYMCRQNQRGAWSPRILTDACISLGVVLYLQPGVFIQGSRWGTCVGDPQSLHDFQKHLISDFIFLLTRAVGAAPAASAGHSQPCPAAGDFCLSHVQPPSKGGFATFVLLLF